MQRSPRCRGTGRSFNWTLVAPMPAHSVPPAHWVRRHAPHRVWKPAAGRNIGRGAATARDRAAAVGETDSQGRRICAGGATELVVAHAEGPSNSPDTAAGI